MDAVILQITPLILHLNVYKNDLFIITRFLKNLKKRDIETLVNEESP